LVAEVWQEAGLDAGVLELDTDGARRTVEEALVRRKVVATHYQHVDGTSFAAPITASVAALMLEANPQLTPAAIKNILISTAERLVGHPSIRQGFGVINARAAIEKAVTEEHILNDEIFFAPRVEGKKIVFSYHADEAMTVALSGDFNEWRHDTQFERNGGGVWRAEIPCQPAGPYRYKFLVDGHRWTEDPSHALKEEDGLGGFNSLLVIR
jgi:serine protease AprX